MQRKISYENVNQAKIISTTVDKAKIGTKSQVANHIKCQEIRPVDKVELWVAGTTYQLIETLLD